MSYQVLARKWRPRTFGDLVGQQHVVQALVNGLDQDRVHHAFLLTGTRGVGKTTIARILAKCLNCEAGVSSTPCGECGSCVDVDEGRFIDMLEIDAASKTKVDDTREMLEGVQYTPTRGRYKVYIIDEVHMLSGHSFNALLKTLEEPPPHVKFVLATTDPQKLPIIILSRCLRFSLSRLLPDQICGQLEKILRSEDVQTEASALMRIARAADGSMRDGLSLLDQAIAFGGGSLKDSEVATMLGSIDHVHIAAIIDALIEADANALLDIVNELTMQSRKLETVLDELAEAMHRIALIQAAPDFRDPERSDWDSLVQRAGVITPEDAQLYYQIAITGGRDMSMAPDPRTGLEMTLLRMMAFRPAQAPAGAQGPQNTQAAEPENQPSGTDDWNSLQASLKLSGAAREFARNLQLESAGHDRWKFLVPDTLQHLGSSSVVKTLQTALSDRLGHTVMLDLHTASEPLQSVAAAAEAAEVSRMSEAERAISEDPTVRQIKEKFGAKIVPDSLQPIQ